jgi:hypothetical protein
MDHHMRYQCIGCGKSPDQLSEYVDAAAIEDITPNEYLKSEEGTLNHENGHFACTVCYVKMGMPSSSRGWKAP